MNIKHLPTNELSLHKQASSLPTICRESGEFGAMLATARELGTLPEPIKVNNFRIIVGAEFLEVARDLGMVTVPCVEVSADDLHATILASLLARRHYTKGQLAFLALPHLQPAIDESKKRRLDNLKKGLTPDCALSAQSGISGAKTAGELAEELGISRRLFTYAAQLHREFAADATIRERFESLILEQDEDGAIMGLGSVVAGIAGYKSTKNITPMIQPELLIWRDRIEKMFTAKRWAGWDNTAPETREQLATAFVRSLRDTCPVEIITAVESSLTPARKRA